MVRWPNLVIVFLAQYLFAYCLIVPFQPIFPKKVFYAVAFSCVLVAAAGNIINDYYDRDIDKINKPDKVYIGKYFSGKTALLLYFLCNILAVVLAVYVDYVQYSAYTTPFVLICIGLLWLYSRYFKKTYLVGNLMIAFLTMGPLLLLTILEVQDWGYGEQFPVLQLFLFFSFWTTLIREILKDCEDREGDASAKAKTLPLVSGLPKTKNVLSILITFIVGVCLALLVFLFETGEFILAVDVLVLIVLFVYLNLKSRKAETPEQFHSTSSFVKIIMLIGTLSMLLFLL